MLKKILLATVLLGIMAVVGFVACTKDQKSDAPKAQEQAQGQAEADVEEGGFETIATPADAPDTDTTLLTLKDDMIAKMEAAFAEYDAKYLASESLKD